MRALVMLFSRLWLAVAAIRPREFAPPRVIRFACHPFVERGHAKTLAGGRGMGWRPLLMALSPVAIVLALVTVGLFLLHGTAGADPGLVLAELALVLPDSVKSKKAEYDRIARELESKQNEYKGKPMPQNVGEEVDRLIKQADEIWSEIEPEIKRAEQMANLNERKSRMGRLGNMVADPILPEDEPEEKKARHESIVAYVSLGEAVIQSEGFRNFVKSNMPRGEFHLLSVPHLEGGRAGGVAYVGMTKSQLEEWQKKAEPVLGSGVIEPTRLQEIVRVTEHDQLVLRDILNVSATASDSVTYTRIASTTRAAAAVAKGAQKPEAGMSLDTVTVPVRTHAVSIPVHNNDLADYPRLRNMIDTELLYDLDKYQEEQMMYGSGTGEEFTGLCVDGDIPTARTAAGDTLIDIIRRAITDVRRSGYQPNAVAIDPLDWEEIELEKGTDSRYVWAVIRDTLGPRIWSLRVVETVAMQANAGNSTEERNLIVGDWIRGATLWVREAANVSVGWVNDQFLKNQRTVLAEQRAAFGTKRPNAFRKHQTQAPVA